VSGQPVAQNTFLDLGFYGQDEWKVRPNVSLTYGLRIETQNEISGSADLAPRIGIAWELMQAKKGSQKPYSVRAGEFLRSFHAGFAFAGAARERHNATKVCCHQSGFLSESSHYGGISGLCKLSHDLSGRPESEDSVHHAGGVTLERQLSKSANIALTYLNSRGVHALLIRTSTLRKLRISMTPAGRSAVRTISTSTKVQESSNKTNSL